MGRQLDMATLDAVEAACEAIGKTLELDHSIVCALAEPILCALVECGFIETGHEMKSGFNKWP